MYIYIYIFIFDSLPALEIATGFLERNDEMFLASRPVYLPKAVWRPPFHALDHAVGQPLQCHHLK